MSKHVSNSTHHWGDEDCDWTGINEAAYEISEYCRKWGRFYCSTKEKYGQVRCCTYLYYSWRTPGKWFNDIVQRYQLWILKRAYRRVLDRYPHLWLEIMIDNPFEDDIARQICPKYEPDKYWKKVSSDE